MHAINILRLIIPTPFQIALLLFSSQLTAHKLSIPIIGVYTELQNLPQICVSK